MTPIETIGSPDARLLISGPQHLYRRAEPVLRALGPTEWLGVDVDRAAAYDVALLDFFWTSMSGAVHALALGQANGVRPADLVGHLVGIGKSCRRS